MKPPVSPGPIVVCLDDEHDVAPLVWCGVSLARLSQAPLYLVFLLVLPAQRPLEILSQEDEQRANTLLDAAVERAAADGVVTTEEIWVTRNRQEAIRQLAEELKASAVILGWQGAGPLRLFDAGLSLLKAVACPVIMVGWGTEGRGQAGWPPCWLSESSFEPEE